MERKVIVEKGRRKRKEKKNAGEIKEDEKRRTKLK